MTTTDILSAATATDRVLQHIDAAVATHRGLKARLTVDRLLRAAAPGLTDDLADEIRQFEQAVCRDLGIDPADHLAGRVGCGCVLVDTPAGPRVVVPECELVCPAEDATGYQLVAITCSCGADRCASCRRRHRLPTATLAPSA